MMLADQQAFTAACRTLAGSYARGVAVAVDRAVAIVW